MKFSIDGKTLRGMKDAESALSRGESKALDNFVDAGSEDDPMMKAAKAEKSNMGTLADLPAGHPVLQELQESQHRYEQEVEIRERPTNGNVRHAKHLDVRRVRRALRDREIEGEETEKDFVNAINAKIEIAAESIAGVRSSLSALMESAPDNHYTRVGVLRLERLLIAANRGLEGCRLRIGRS